ACFLSVERRQLEHRVLARSGQVVGVGRAGVDAIPAAEHRRHQRSGEEAGQRPAQDGCGDLGWELGRPDGFVLAGRPDAGLARGSQVADPVGLAEAAHDEAPTVDLEQADGECPWLSGAPAADGQQDVRAHRHAGPKEPADERVERPDEGRGDGWLGGARGGHRIDALLSTRGGVCRREHEPIAQDVTGHVRAIGLVLGSEAMHGEIARGADEVNRREWLAGEFERQRPHLRAVAYRMLGSLTEAEDAVQESWVRLDRHDPGGPGDLRGWLTVVVGRICLDMLRSRRARREQYAGTWLPEPIVAPVTGSTTAP